MGIMAMGALTPDEYEFGFPAQPDQSYRFGIPSSLIHYPPPLPRTVVLEPPPPPPDAPHPTRPPQLRADVVAAYNPPPASSARETGIVPGVREVVEVSTHPPASSARGTPGDARDDRRNAQVLTRPPPRRRGELARTGECRPRAAWF